MNTASVLGEMMASAEYGTSVRDANFIKGAGEVLSAPGSDFSAAALCALGYSIFEGAGEGTCFQATLLKTAAAEPDGNPLVDRLARMVTSVLIPEPSKCASVADAAKNLLIPATTRSLAFTPDLLKLVLGGSVLAGGTAGALAYAAKRHTTRGDAETEKLKSRLAFYRQLSDEMKSRMETSGIAA